MIWPRWALLTAPRSPDERVHLFAGAGLVEQGVRRDRDELIEVVVFPLSHALEAGPLRAPQRTRRAWQRSWLAHAFLATVWPEARSAPPR